MKKLTFIACCFCLYFQAFSQSPVLITDQQWTVFRDPDGPPFGQNTGPAGVGDMGWTTLSYVESTSWKPSSIVNMGCLTPYGQMPAVNCNATSNPIWAKRIGCSYANDIVYFRRKFTVPAEENCGYIIKIKADNNSYVYLNGQYVGSTINNWVNGNVLFLNPVVGQNVIAVQVYDDGTTGWFSAVMCKVCTEPTPE